MKLYKFIVCNYTGAVYDVDLGNHGFNIGTNHLFNVDVINDGVGINIAQTQYTSFM